MDTSLWPDQMRAVRLSGPGCAPRLEAVPLPRPASDDVVLRPDGVFTGGNGGGGAIPLTVQECLRLGGKVELHQWCNTGLKCTTYGGQHAVCIDEGVVSR